MVLDADGPAYTWASARPLHVGLEDYRQPLRTLYSGSSRVLIMTHSIVALWSAIAG